MQPVLKLAVCVYVRRVEKDTLHAVICIVDPNMTGI
jgi:hypothetical protein